MARREIVNQIVKLYQKLGGNVSDVLGTKTNVSFIGKGEPEILKMDLNTNALGALPQSKALAELKESVSFAAGDKLNDLQASKLLENMSKMDEFYNPAAAPANITDLKTGVKNLDKEGLMSLRKDNVPFPEVEDYTSAPTGAGLEAIKSVKNNSLIVDDLVNKVYQMSGVAENAKPVARANARDFLNRIKDMEDPDFPGGTTLSSVMEADDLRFATEGGGGGFGDPLLLVQKYFGPKVASAVAKLDSPNDIQEFAENLVKIKDAKGNSVTSRYFDPESVSPDDFEFAEGGRVPAANSQLVKESDKVLGYRGDAAYRSNSEQSLSIGQGNVGTKSDFGDGPAQGGGNGNNNNGGGGNNNPPIVPFVEKDNIINTIPVKAGFEGVVSDNSKLKAYLDFRRSLEDEELYGQVDFTGNLGGIDIGASANLAGDKNINLGYQTQGGTNLGFTTDLNNNAMFTLNKTFADGGRVPMFAGGAARIGYQALRKYGIEAKDISRLFASLGTDKSLVGKEKTMYFKQLNQVLKNPDDFPDGIREIQIRLGIDPIGFKSGGLAGILEV